MTATTKHFMDYLESSIAKNWSSPALSDFDGNANYTYGEMAKNIARLHLLFAESGIAQGDKIALCGRNSSNWAVAFLATLTYGAIAVPILHEFMPDQVHNIVNHSDAKLLFAGDVVSTVIDATKMPALEGIIYIPDYSLLVSRTDKLT